MAHYMLINTTVHQEAQTVLKILKSAVTQQCLSDILWTTQNTALHIRISELVWNQISIANLTSAAVGYTTRCYNIRLGKTDQK